MLSDSLGNRYIVLNSKDVLKQNTIEQGSFISFIVDGEEMIRQEVNDDKVYDDQTIFVQVSSIIGDAASLEFGFMRQPNY